MTDDLDCWIGFFKTMRSDIVKSAATLVWEQACLLDGSAADIIAKMEAVVVEHFRAEEEMRRGKVR